MSTNSKFGLKQKNIQSIQTVFLKYSSIESVIIYGSRAIGNFREGSDIDLVLVAPKLTLSDLFKIENELDDLMLPYKMDLSLYHQIENEDLKNHIKNFGQKFYP